MAGLGATECCGIVGLDAFSEDPATVRIKPGRNIHRHYRNRVRELGLIDQVDDVGEVAVDLAAETSPEEGVNNGITGKTVGIRSV